LEDSLLFSELDLEEVSELGLEASELALEVSELAFELFEPSCVVSEDWDWLELDWDWLESLLVDWPELPEPESPVLEPAEESAALRTPEPTAPGV
jgi:hypothetical protein